MIDDTLMMMMREGEFCSCFDIICGPHGIGYIYHCIYTRYITYCIICKAGGNYFTVFFKIVYNCIPVYFMLSQLCNSFCPSSTTKTKNPKKVHKIYFMRWILFVVLWNGFLFSGLSFLGERQSFIFNNHHPSIIMEIVAPLLDFSIFIINSVMQQQPFVCFW